MNYVKKKRVALFGEIVITPVYDKVDQVSEIEAAVNKAILAGYTCGATVIRPHHANAKREELPDLVGTVIGYNRSRNYGGGHDPIRVRWGSPYKFQGWEPFSYQQNQLDLFHYTWEEVK